MAFGDEGEQGASFNMAVATLIRMDEDLRKSKFYAEYGMLDCWKTSLDCLHREVTPFMDRPERSDIKKIKFDINELLVKYQRMIDRQNMNPSLNTKKITNAFYTKLYEYETFLRESMFKHDLLMPRKDDPRYAVGKRHYG